MTNLNEIKITPRDQQVLRLLVQGCSNKEIAAQLEISPRTVKQHLRTLSCGGNQGRAQTRETGDCHVTEGADGIMPPRTD